MGEQRRTAPQRIDVPDDAPEPWRLASTSRVRVGTASWTDKTLVESGLFYPRDAKSPAERLRFYADAFPLVEVDATYYALPSERNAHAWAERTPPGFVFNVKAFSLLTQHPTRVAALPKDLRDSLGDAATKTNVYPRDVPAEVVGECWSRFFEAMAPLAQARKLVSFLFQFPEWFTPGRANRDYILECRDRIAAAMPDAWCAVELRNAAWMSDEARQERTLSFLAEHMLPYVCVDMPQGLPRSIPPVARATAPLALVRFHGRNQAAWAKRGATVHERFRYDYSEDELAEWTPRIRSLAQDAQEVHVLMNNCYSDYSVRSARNLTQLLLEDGL